jgi:Tfp pilus assembly protein PilF
VKPTRTLPFALLLAAGCSSAPQEETTRSIPVNEVRQAGQASQQAPEPVDPDEWRAARGSILRTFAFRALDKKLIKEARQYLTEACEMDPGDTASHAALARLYLAEGDSQSALVYAERAATAKPGDPEISMVYAAALAETNQVEKATETLEATWTAIEQDPRFARSILTHYAAMGKTQEARDFVRELLLEDPNHASTWATSADLMLAEGDLEGAVEGYRRALEIDPNTPTPASVAEALGSESGVDPMRASLRAAERREDWDAAANLYRFLVDAHPLDTDLRLGYARSLWELERIELADAQMREVPIGVRGWRGHLLQAKLDIRAERWGSARTALDLAIVERPELRAAALLRGYVEERIAAERSEDAGTEDA